MQPNLYDFDDFPTVGVTPFDVWLTHVMFIMVFKKKVYTYQEWTETLDREHWGFSFDCGMTPDEAVDEELSYWGD